VVRNNELATSEPAALLPAGTRYVVLSNLARSPEFSRLWQFSTSTVSRYSRCRHIVRLGGYHWQTI
jgi:hypothetical protein